MAPCQATPNRGSAPQFIPRSPAAGPAGGGTIAWLFLLPGPGADWRYRCFAWWRPPWRCDQAFTETGLDMSEPLAVRGAGQRSPAASKRSGLLSRCSAPLLYLIGVGDIGGARLAHPLAVLVNSESAGAGDPLVPRRLSTRRCWWSIVVASIAFRLALAEKRLIKAGWAALLGTTSPPSVFLTSPVAWACPR